MCGIAGVFYNNSAETERFENDVKEMVGCLRHRGPDDKGIWRDVNCQMILGHSRLAIIDLTVEGHQPMVSGSGRYVISYNGEIYNFLELKNELKSSGVTFHGGSDTEVLLEAISYWGLINTLNKLLGMFAFAVWDNLEKKLFLARDRGGKKPLYYYQKNDLFCFASELKAIKTLESIRLETDESALYHYLTFGYIPFPQTMYREIQQLSPGCLMTVDKQLAPTQEKYWEVQWERKKEQSFAEAVEYSDYLISDAVRIRLRADVPVGCFLSGGIDSGLITAIASKQLGSPLKTFTIGFKDDTFDESQLAAKVAERYKTSHTLINLSPNLDDVLPKVVKAYDQPFADPSSVPSYCVSEIARKHVKVVLNGEGSDELFGGYRRHLAMVLLQRYKPLLGAAPGIFWKWLNRLLPSPDSYRSKYAFAHRFIRGVNENPYDRYITWCVDGFSEGEKETMYKNSKGVVKSSTDFLKEKYGNLGDLGLLDHFMAIDYLFNMSNDMLIKMDIATMAHSLEARCPFLDHRIVEWTATLHHGVRMKGGKTKPILRALAMKYLPEEVVNAPKRGFEIPLIKWLREDLNSLVRDECLRPNGIVLALFKRDYVENLLLEKIPMDPDRWSRRVWTLLMLAMWDSQNR